jgi:hypothetical protein
MTVAVGTAVARDELALARVLAAGLGRAHPDWRLTVLLLDGDPAGLDDEPFETVGMDKLGVPDLGLLQTVASSSHALAAAVRPVLLSRLLEAADVAIWLDSTVRVVDRLDALAGGESDLVVVPLQPQRGRTSGLGIRAPFESGAVAVSDPAAARWWTQLIGEQARREGSSFDPVAGDSIGALLAVVDRVEVVRDAGLCAGWWTLTAGERLAGEPTAVGGDPLRAINLAGFDPHKPHWLSSEDPEGAARVSDSPALAALLDGHANDLLAAGWQPPGRWAYSELPNGLPLDDDMRDLFALAQRRGAELESPFTPAGCDAFMDWIGGESTIGSGVSWYLERVHRRRFDLRVAFPDLAGGDASGLAAWMETQGHVEEPVLAELLRRRVAPPLASAEVDRDIALANEAPVRIVGYLGEGLGLGEAARSYARALRAAGVTLDSVSVPVPLSRSLDTGGGNWSRNSVEWAVAAGGGEAEPSIEIVCMNPPELLRAQRAGVVSSARGRRIGVWAWELATLPADWVEALPLVDEVWAYSDYVAAALRPHLSVPVEVMPLTVDVPSLPAPTPDAAPFTFLFVFDLLSSVERKNPLGLIDAYKAAFGPDDGTRLLIKTSNGENVPEQLERVRVAALGRGDIEVVDAFLTPAERDSLIAGCDCYVSLHRAEGFGLTIAEAMAAARPTIATGFSGNLDFMDDDCAYLVDWSPAEVQAGSQIYPAGARWAEPDVEHAASLMRAVRTDPEAAAQRGLRGRERIATQLSPAAVGERARVRIEGGATLANGARRGIKARLSRRVRG